MISVTFRCVILAYLVSWVAVGARVGGSEGGGSGYVRMGVGWGGLRSTGYVGRKGLLSASWTS